MEKRPILSVPKTLLERLHDSISVVVLVYSVVYLILRWTDLPETIPIHFDGHGNADGWGSRAFLLFMPLLTIVLFIGLSLLSKIPHKFNYLRPITAQNAAHQYRTAKSLLSWIKVELVILFGYLQWSTIQNAAGHSSGLGIWLLPVTLIVIFGTVIIHIVRMRK
ncbi:hypothetical protein PAECIP111893_01208 [Paenibacillus plantiphilus]|uniref:DUF1648 domain-containing protein n=1 Tax=Paenibacillus plantiphilus TaxID=2905650 RepID=A0ABM9SFC9_9BACL|nr:DUF1648 domain-containing protein [Paenibacillus plantiphilus]CAH1199014.1 hypothetical protein PAECIP111893_01208 [Paenibacillus plantiphilus]